MPWPSSPRAFPFAYLKEVIVGGFLRWMEERDESFDRVPLNPISVLQEQIETER
jgi:hypothetical protein